MMINKQMDWTDHMILIILMLFLQNEFHIDLDIWELSCADLSWLRVFYRHCEFTSARKVE